MSTRTWWCVAALCGLLVAAAAPVETSVDPSGAPLAEHSQGAMVAESQAIQTNTHTTSVVLKTYSSKKDVRVQTTPVANTKAPPASAGTNRPPHIAHDTHASAPPPAPTNATSNETTTSNSSLAVPTTHSVEKPSSVSLAVNHPRAPSQTTSKKMLLVAVCTAPSHFEQRMAIRHTWGGNLMAPEARHQYDVLFFIGKVVGPLAEAVENSISVEQRHYNDIVRLDSFEEAYSNLTRKVLAMATWAADRPYEAMMKVDDDTFVLLDRVIHDVLETEPDRALLWWGKFWGSDDRPVDRDPQSKYFMSPDQYQHETFPNYPDGPCYILGSAMLQYLSANRDRLTIYSLEDAAMGIWFTDDATDITMAIQQVYGSAYMYDRYCPQGDWYYYVNPLSSDELRTVMSNYYGEREICANGFNLEICSSRQGCLCNPSNSSCWGTH